MKLAKFGYFHDIAWYSAIFTKLAKFHDFWLFSWSWPNFTIFGYFHEVGKISWYFAWSWQNLMFFVFMKLLELFNFCIFDVCLFLLSGQNSMIFDYFYEVGKILSIFEYFHVVGKFHNFWLLSWSRHNFFAVFMILAKKISLFSRCCQNFMIFGSFYEVGKIS